MPEFNEAEMNAIIAVLKSDALQLLIGAEEWDLTEDQENALWSAIDKAGAELPPIRDVPALYVDCT